MELEKYVNKKSLAPRKGHEVIYNSRIPYDPIKDMDVYMKNKHIEYIEYTHNHPDRMYECTCEEKNISIAK